MNFCSHFKHLGVRQGNLFLRNSGHSHQGGATPEQHNIASLTRWAHERPKGRKTNPYSRMAFRPYENLIDGELNNRTSGKVTGWMRFFRRGESPLQVTLDLEGDCHEDIRGKVIRLRNRRPSDRNELLDREGTYMWRFSPVQRGVVGDITAGRPLGPWTQELAQNLMAQNEIIWDETGLTGDERERARQELAEIHRQYIEAGDLYYPYVSYPYIEWYSDNGRVVLELDPKQVEVLETDQPTQHREKTPRELVEDERKRSQAFAGFMTGVLEEISEEVRKVTGDGTVAGVVVG